MPDNIEPLNHKAALSSDSIEQIKRAQALKKYPLAKLISLFENQTAAAFTQRHQIISYLEQQNSQPKGVVIGITGTPGAGKSSLIAEICQYLLTQKVDLRIAVLAVDPSSQVSGGAILGDRLRMRSHGKEARLFFRSQASNLELGGVTQNTYQATRLLRHLFDVIFIETVGIGQNEIEIQNMADHSVLVMQPLAGDQIQFMKCGIMEIPDSFVVNKCDEEKLAKTSYYMLRTALKQARIVQLSSTDDFTQASRDQIFLTSATKGNGIADLADFLHSIAPKANMQRDIFYVAKKINRDFGAFGMDIFNQYQQQIAAKTTFEAMELWIREKIQQRIRSD